MLGKSNKVMRRSQVGFTIVELLAVMAVSAILFALVAGTAGKIQKAAQNTGCVANLRSIGSAIAQYANDHDGYLPGPSYGNMPSTYSYSLNGDNVLTAYLAPYLDCPPQENSVSHACPVMLCPAFKYKTSLPASQWNRARSYAPVYQLSGVTLSGGVVPSPWGRPATPGLNMNSSPLKLATIASLVKPSATWAIMDADSLSGIGGEGLSPVPVHSGHWNRLYFDFHVESTPTAAP